MRLYIIEDYKSRYPHLKGRALTDALVKDILQEDGCLEAHEEPSIRRLPEGKPVLDHPAGVCLSVSHTGDVFGCVIHTDEVGLDLQKTEPRDMMRLARRYFREDEVALLEKCGGDLQARQKRFFQLWTRKEAYGKFTGEGLAALLEREQMLDREDVVFQDLYFGDGLYGCVCSRNNGG